MEADTDRDGKISFEEFTKMVENTDVSMSMTLGESSESLSHGVSADSPLRSDLVDTLYEAYVIRLLTDFGLYEYKLTKIPCLVAYLHYSLLRSPLHCRLFSESAGLQFPDCRKVSPSSTYISHPRGLHATHTCKSVAGKP